MALANSSFNIIMRQEQWHQDNIERQKANRIAVVKANGSCQDCAKGKKVLSMIKCSHKGKLLNPFNYCDVYKPKLAEV